MSKQNQESPRTQTFRMDLQVTVFESDDQLFLEWHLLFKATITLCDLSPRFVSIGATLLKTIRYESTSLIRIVANKSHRVA